MEKGRDGGRRGGGGGGRGRHGEPSGKELRGGVEVEEEVMSRDKKIKYESCNDA